MLWNNFKEGYFHGFFKRKSKKTHIWLSDCPTANSWKNSHTDFLKVKHITTTSLSLLSLHEGIKRRNHNLLISARSITWAIYFISHIKPKSKHLIFQVILQLKVSHNFLTLKSLFLEIGHKAIFIPNHTQSCLQST